MEPKIKREETTQKIDKEHPTYQLEIIRHNAQWDVKEEREDIEKDEKKRKGRRNAVVTTAIYLGLLYVLYLAAHQFSGFKLFSLS
ncbi:MAG: hypothetical protein K6T85_14385 [Gorillibacterium sp.]|nr:hypothetical protein [Gorillibacterium sp.]